MPSTPKKRAKSNGSAGILRGLKAIASAQGIEPVQATCLLSLDKNYIQTCVISKTLHPEAVTQLEYIWGYKYNTLNLDTRYNLFHPLLSVNPTLHAAFDAGTLALLPHLEDMIPLYNHFIDLAKKGSQLPKITPKIYKGKKLFEYTLLYLDTAPRLYIVRGNFTDGRTCHDPPFSSFPTITSHVHPHLVVFNLGEKLRRLQPLDRELVEDRTPGQVQKGMKLAALLYASWMRSIDVPPDFQVEKCKGSASSSRGRNSGSLTRSRSSCTEGDGDDSGGGDNNNNNNNDDDDSDDDDDDDDDELEEADKSESVLYDWDHINAWRNTTVFEPLPRHGATSNSPPLNSSTTV
ncbi:hypothetical protein P691DRAFT_784388 [Macrolepiota fuliginosa MF-IS2]|uniref:HNH nuclease domain-containing protein n=1 Tax=Macrolepiota fuliginosa MF-IS2 TaxID=1400762 RepID=A0A9P5X7S4_9AGAR|nr:hypothetical protein P691DRAFT_784388 [Macrolepiota fuliginosa MF-IS2]